MDINDLDFVKSSLAAMRPADWAAVSDKSGVPLGTLRKIAYGEVIDPRFWTVQKLADHFRGEISAADERRARTGRRHIGRRSTDKNQ